MLCCEGSYTPHPTPYKLLRVWEALDETMLANLPGTPGHLTLGPGGEADNSWGQEPWNHHLRQGVSWGPSNSPPQNAVCFLCPHPQKLLRASGTELAPLLHFLESMEDSAQLITACLSVPGDRGSPGGQASTSSGAAAEEVPGKAVTRCRRPSELRVACLGQEARTQQSHNRHQ